AHGNIRERRALAERRRHTHGCVQVSASYSGLLTGPNVTADRAVPTKAGGGLPHTGRPLATPGRCPSLAVSQAKDTPRYTREAKRPPHSVVDGEDPQRRERLWMVVAMPLDEQAAAAGALSGGVALLDALHLATALEFG